MGIGDEIMASGEARRLFQADQRPACIVDKHGRPRWHDIWRGNPRITPDLKGAHRLVNAGGCRPYIDYARSTKDRWAWADWRAEPGDIHLTPAEKTLAQPVIIVEPHIKPSASPNKQWGWGRWQELVGMAPHLPWAQVGPRGTRCLDGVRLIETAAFREACGVLSGATAAVLPEGALHHAAAALGVHAVVLFGAFIPPAVTGYDMHRNLWIDDPDALGWRVPNTACAAAWGRITPDIVMDNLMEILRGL